MTNFLAKRNNQSLTNSLSSALAADPWNWVDRFFDTQSLRSPVMNDWARDFSPAIDVEDTEKEYKVHADLPGLKREDINVDYKDGVLTISGERQEKRESATYIERSFGKFTRSFRLPQDVVTEKVEAKYNDGVLSVVLPKKADAAGRKIQIS